jgi:hypothetical protein
MAQRLLRVWKKVLEFDRAASNILRYFLGLECGSVVEHLTSMCKALGLIPHMQETKAQNKHTKVFFLHLNLNSY